MGSRELDQNRSELLRLCQAMGVMDHFDELWRTAMDQQHLSEGTSPFSREQRDVGGHVFVTRSWIREHLKRIDRGPQPDLGLFDRLD